MFVDLGPRPVLTAIALAAALSTSSCADTRGGTIPYDRALATSDVPRIETLDANYRIAPLDKITIKVFKSDEISGDYDVDLAGHIPFVGEVEAANRGPGPCGVFGGPRKLGPSHGRQRSLLPQCSSTVSSISHCVPPRSVLASACALRFSLTVTPLRRRRMRSSGAGGTWSSSEAEPSS